MRKKGGNLRNFSPEGFSVEYGVLGDLVINSPASFLWFEKGWGPRICMTGEKCWSLGASGFAGIAGGLLGRVCKVSAPHVAFTSTTAWNKFTAKLKWAHDDLCYDRSRFMNIGWEKAPC